MMHSIDTFVKRRWRRLGARMSSSRAVAPMDTSSPPQENPLGGSSSLPLSRSDKALSRADSSDRGSVSTASTSSSSLMSDWSDESDLCSIRSHRGQAPPATRRKGCLRFPTQLESLSQVYTRSRGGTEAEGTTASRQRATLANGVKFKQVTIHRHLIILGDNPSPSEGPPISIEWKAFESCTFDLEAYEASKPKPRKHHELLLARQWREGWLIINGTPRRSMQTVQREVQRIQKSRHSSAVAYVLESAPTDEARREVERQLNRRSAKSLLAFNRCVFSC